MVRHPLTTGLEKGPLPLAFPLIEDGWHAPVSRDERAPRLVPHAPTTADEKARVARDILGAEDLPAWVLKGIEVGDDSLQRLLAREEERHPKLGELMDSGVIGPGTSAGWFAKKPFKDGDPFLIGLHEELRYDHLYKHVGQNFLGLSRDVPMISDGFSSCHAVFLFDRTAGEAALLHVQHADADTGQVEAVNRRWPHRGERELIYGSNLHVRGILEPCLRPTRSCRAQS